MRSILRTSWFPVLLGLIFTIAILRSVSERMNADSSEAINQTGFVWVPPDINLVPSTPEGEFIRYGHELIVNTSRYLGPKGIVASSTNGMNCQNCHMEAGSRLFGSSLAAVATTYPRFRERSGRIESIEYRINECLERSLNGKTIDSTSKEMRAMVAYLKWLGRSVPKDIKVPGIANVEIPYLDRAADPAKGKAIFVARCQLCHGSNGEGVMYEDSTGYRYPPLWGEHSYNVSAGLYRLVRLAAFVKYNMPFSPAHIAPQLSDEESWDLAAFINSQPRPQKRFAYDWPNIATKPPDHPFGPYADGFSEEQHKYGPFGPIIKAREARRKVLSRESGVGNLVDSR